jgi:hypothetical protein
VTAPDRCACGHAMTAHAPPAAIALAVLQQWGPFGWSCQLMCCSCRAFQNPPERLNGSHR